MTGTVAESGIRRMAGAYARGTEVLCADIHNWYVIGHGAAGGWVRSCASCVVTR